MYLQILYIYIRVLIPLLNHNASSFTISNNQIRIHPFLAHMATLPLQPLGCNPAQSWGCGVLRRCPEAERSRSHAILRWEAHRSRSFGSVKYGEMLIWNLWNPWTEILQWPFLISSPFREPTLWESPSFWDTHVHGHPHVLIGGEKPSVPMAAMICWWRRVSWMLGDFLTDSLG